MSRVLVYLGRFALILAGYAIASLAASAFLHVVTLGSLGFTADEAPAVLMGSIVFSIPFVALFVAYFAFLPAIPAILLSEILGKRDWLYHAISGAVVALVIVGHHQGRGGGRERSHRYAFCAGADRRRHVRRHRLLAGGRPPCRKLARACQATGCRGRDASRVGYWPVSPCS